MRQVYIVSLDVADIDQALTVGSALREFAKALDEDTSVVHRCASKREFDQFGLWEQKKLPDTPPQRTHAAR